MTFRNKVIHRKPTLYGVHIIVKDSSGRILLGERINTIGEGTWGTPGGRSEGEESIIHCATREAKEETSLDIYESQIFGEFKISAYGYNFNFFGVVTESYLGEPAAIPGESHSRWEWYNMDELPSNLFIPSQVLINGYNHFLKNCSKELYDRVVNAGRRKR